MPMTQLLTKANCLTASVLSIKTSVDDRENVVMREMIICVMTCRECCLRCNKLSYDILTHLVH